MLIKATIKTNSIFTEVETIQPVLTMPRDSFGEHIDGYLNNSKNIIYANVIKSKKYYKLLRYNLS